MANLRLIRFWIGLSININAGDGRKGFEVHSLRDVAGMTIDLYKVDRDDTFAQN